jgi:hypothetical protein
LERHDSGMIVDMSRSRSRKLPTSCPVVSAVHGFTIGPVPTSGSANDSRNFWSHENQASSLSASVSLQPLEISHPTIGHVAAVSLDETFPTADTDAFMDFSADHVRSRPVLRTTNPTTNPVRSPFRSLVDHNKTFASHHHHGKSSLERCPASGSRRTPPKLAGPPARVAHKLVERRYRNKMKTHLDTLSSRIPAIRSSYPFTLEVEETPGSSKGPPKATIIAGAINYIEELEFEREEARHLIERLQEQVVGLQKLVECDDCSLLRYFASAKPEIVDSNELQ